MPAMACGPCLAAAAAAGCWACAWPLGPVRLPAAASSPVLPAPVLVQLIAQVVTKVGLQASQARGISTQAQMSHKNKTKFSVDTFNNDVCNEQVLDRQPHACFPRL